MERIHIHQVDKKTFTVTVNAATTTTHNVTVEPAYYQKLTGGHTTMERLLVQSFEFLLEREPNTSILRQFELPVIERYFPEYPDTIRKMLAD